MFANEFENEIIACRIMVRDQLRRRGIADENVLRIMEQLPRHRFIPSDKQSQAYLDQPVAIGLGQTISQPYIVALMTEKLEIKPEHLVLEIGTGCGYQTAVLAQLARRVCTVELLEPLAQQARNTLAEMNITNVEYRIGDGSKGWPDPMLFDRILVAAAPETVPQPLLDQLALRGVMVIPIGPADNQRLLRIERQGDKLQESLLCYCRFVKLIETKTE